MAVGRRASLFASSQRADRSPRSYRRVRFLLFSMVTFFTGSEEKHHGDTCQEGSREIREQNR